jgi:hypothetical protein
MNKLYIGVSGFARSGKNLFCDIAQKVLKEKYNLTSKTYALAYFLKKDCEPFIQEKLGLSSFSEKTEDKNAFREMLVWYGGVKRKQTEGKYWTGLLHKELNKDTNDVNFISDIRYVEYVDDEVFWLKKQLNGKLVHVSKYTYGFPSDGRHYRINDKSKKIYTEAPNQHEALNDPKIRILADYKVEWEQIVIGNNQNDLINNSNLNSIVEECLKTIVK